MKKHPFVFALMSSILIFFSCENQPQNTTSIGIKLEELTVAQIHQAYNDGDYTAEELVAAYLERIAQKDSILNAITVLNPDAVDQAQALDQEFQKTGALRPLHGIPMIVKDNFITTGMVTTAGALILKDFYAEENAVMVQQLIDAGAIILAKSNMAEWAFSPKHTESSTFGTTRNPYNTDHVPAGSSGGTGAAVPKLAATAAIG
ncbi:MAG: amidase, partial [Bacteroidota bacterium]